jgi:hypothetical protein
VAAAATVGYGAFALGLVLTAAVELRAGAAARARFALASFAPALWTGAAVFGACRFLGAESPGVAFERSLVVVVLLAPVLAYFARGTGLRHLARDHIVAPAA